MTEDSTNTAQEHPKKAIGRPFVKGDARINRKGRPRSFDKLRALAQEIGNEIAKKENGEPVIEDGELKTRVEMVLRDMMKNNPERFIEIGWGKVPDKLEITDSTITVKLKRDDES